METEKLWKNQKNKVWKVKVFCDIWMGGIFGMASLKMINLMFFGFLISSASTFQSGRFVLSFCVFVHVDDAVNMMVYYWCCWLLFKVADFSNFLLAPQNFPYKPFLLLYWYLYVVGVLLLTLMVVLLLVDIHIYWLLICFGVADHSYLPRPSDFSQQNKMSPVITSQTRTFRAPVSDEVKYRDQWDALPHTSRKRQKDAHLRAPVS